MDTSYPLSLIFQADTPLGESAHALDVAVERIAKVLQAEPHPWDRAERCPACGAVAMLIDQRCDACHCRARDKWAAENIGRGADPKLWGTVRGDE